MIEFAVNYGQIQLEIMEDLTVPFGVLSQDGRLLWGNDEFIKVIVNKKAAKRSISNIFGEITTDKIPKDENTSIVHVMIMRHFIQV